LIRLGIEFPHARTNSAMAHVLVSSAKVRRIEQSWQTLDIGNMLRPTLDFNYSQQFQFEGKKITKKITVLLNSIFLEGEICTSIYFSKFDAKSL
jgi:hypothetical protein